MIYKFSLHNASGQGTFTNIKIFSVVFHFSSTSRLENIWGRIFRAYCDITHIFAKSPASLLVRYIGTRFRMVGL